MGPVWIIADTHFGKQPKDRIRATGLSGQDLDRKIVEAWRALIKPSDAVWHLGDVGDLQFMEALPGLKRLIKGNDDKKKDCLASGAFVDVQLRNTVDGIQLVHRPQDATENGTVFHGHLHALSDPRQNFVCLSVDQTEFSPVSWTDAVYRSTKKLNKCIGA